MRSESSTFVMTAISFYRCDLTLKTGDHRTLIGDYRLMMPIYPTQSVQKSGFNHFCQLMHWIL